MVTALILFMTISDVSVEFGRFAAFLDVLLNAGDQRKREIVAGVSVFKTPCGMDPILSARVGLRPSRLDYREVEDAFS